MQKRFCTCGHQVFVDYAPGKSGWNPLIIIKNTPKKQNRKGLPCCPNCGTPLNINSLR